MSLGMIAAMVFVLLLTIAVPAGAMLFLHRRGGSRKVFLVGAGTFVVFAVGLEPIMHNLVFPSGIGQTILGNTWLYGLYGGFAASLFEETGRLLAFRFVLKRRNDRATALSYGIGHGGIEAFLVAGLTMIQNLIFGLIYARGGTIPSEIVPSVEALLATPASMFLWAGVERLSAMILHTALSVLVFAAVRTGKWKLLLAAFLIHWGGDFIFVVSAAYLPVAAAEGLLLLIVIQVAIWAVSIYEKLLEIAENP